MPFINVQHLTSISLKLFCKKMSRLSVVCLSPKCPAIDFGYWRSCTTALVLVKETSI